MLIFVYGTLLKGLERSCVLESSDFIGDAVAKGVQLYDLGSYPAIIKADGTVIGEIYSVNDETLEILDAIEGFYSNDLDGSLYLRSNIKIISPIITSEVFSYYYNLPLVKKTQIVDGDYQKFLLAKSNI